MKRYTAPYTISTVYVVANMLAESDPKRKDDGRLVGTPQSVAWDFNEAICGSELLTEEDEGQ